MSIRNLFPRSRSVSLTTKDSSSEIQSTEDQTSNERLKSSESDDESPSILNFSGLAIKTLFDRKLDDIFIELDEPHKVYGPGDSVRGRVNLVIPKAIRTMYVALRFYGQVSVGSGKQVVKDSLFQRELILWGQQNKISTTRLDLQDNGKEELSSTISEDRLEHDSVSAVHAPHAPSAQRSSWSICMIEPGRHVFEFEFSFPKMSLPSTVDFGRGSISYLLRCEHQRPQTLTSRSRSICRKELAFLDAIDVGHVPRPRIRHIDSDVKAKRKEGSGKVQASVELAKAGYLKGETIALNVQVKHVKPIKNMRGTIVTLYRLSRFNSSDVAPQSFRKDLAQSISPLLVDPGTLEYKVSPRLRVPADVFPTVKVAGAVSFRYFIEVVLDLNGRTTVWQGGTSNAKSESTNHFSVEHGGLAMDTEALKREKGAHCVVFEVVIGTRDSTAQINNEREIQNVEQYVALPPPRAHISGLRESSIVLSDSHPASYEVHETPPHGYSMSPSHDTDPAGRTEVQHRDPRQSSRHSLTKDELRSLEDALLPSAPPAAFDAEIPLVNAPSAPALEPDELQVSNVSELSHVAEVPHTSEKELVALQHFVSAPPDCEGSYLAGTAPSLEAFGLDECPHTELPSYARNQTIRSDTQFQ